MNEFLMGVDWASRVFELLVFAFLIVRFWRFKTELLFGGKGQITSLRDHETHSCFIAALCVLVFHFVGSGMAFEVLENEAKLEKLQLRQLYYFVLIINATALSATLYGLHRLRGCSFSKAAKRCMYLAVIAAFLHFMQLILRGVYDFNALSSFYVVAMNIVNLTSLVVVAEFPIKLIIQTGKSKEA